MQVDDSERGGPTPGNRPNTSPTNLKDNAPYPPRVTRDVPHGHLVDPVTVQQLCELLADHDHHDQRAADAYRDGYTDGHASGWEIGYAHAHEEMARHWQALAESIRSRAGSLSFAELERRRSEPGGIVYEQAKARRNMHRSAA